MQVSEMRMRRYMSGDWSKDLIRIAYIRRNVGVPNIRDEGGPATVVSSMMR